MSPNPAAMASKAAPISVLLLVFLCGAMAGAVAMNLGAHKSLHRSPFWTDAAKAVYLERVKKDLNLSPMQTEQLEGILDDFAKYYQTVLSDGKSRILAILNDEQKHKFEQMLQQRIAAH